MVFHRTAFSWDTATGEAMISTVQTAAYTNHHRQYRKPFQL